MRNSWIIFKAFGNTKIVLKNLTKEKKNLFYFIIIAFFLFILFIYFIVHITF